MPKAPGDWMKSEAWLASAGHFLAGCNILLSVALFSHAWTPLLWAELTLAATVLPKEFWYDLRYESGETLASSTLDALGYGIGSAVAWSLIALARHCGQW